MVAAGSGQPHAPPKAPPAPSPCSPVTPPPCSSLLSPRDSALLNALIHSNFDLPRTAAEHGLSTPELLAWLNTQAIQTIAADLLRTSQTFLEIKVVRARMAVVDTLQDIALNHDSTTERRRAATALCRRFGGPLVDRLDRFGVRRPPRIPPFTDAAAPDPQPEPTPIPPIVPPPIAPPPAPSVPCASPAPSAPLDPSPSPHLHNSVKVIPAGPVLHDPRLPLPTQDPSTQHSGLSFLPDDDDNGGHHAVLPWPMPDAPDPDSPSRLACLIFNAFANRDLPRLACTFLHHAADDAALDNRPLKETLPRHILATMYRSREIAFVEHSRAAAEAAYTFTFERAPLSPTRASFRFLFTRALNRSWLISRIDTLDTS